LTKLFSDAPDQGDDYVAQATAKFKKDDGSLDVDALAKSWGHGQQHIGNLETEQAGLRKDLEQRLTMETFLEKITKAPAAPPSSSDNQDDEEPPKKPEIDLAQVTKLVEDKITATQRQATAQANVDYVAKKLQEVWGDGFSNKLNARAKELGVSKDFLGGMAESHPQAFLELVIPKTSSVTPSAFVPPQSTTRSATTTKGNDAWANFEEIRKKDPQKYWSREVQNEIHKQALDGRLPQFKQG
jgi:hypothetical protein